MVTWHAPTTICTLVWHTHYMHQKDTTKEYAAGGLEIKNCFDQKLQCI